jgi:transposase
LTKRALLTTFGA